MPSSLTPGVMILMPNGGHSPVFARNSWRETRWKKSVDVDLGTLKSNMGNKQSWNLKMMVFPKRNLRDFRGPFSGSMISFRGVRCSVFFFNEESCGSVLFELFLLRWTISVCGGMWWNIKYTWYLVEREVSVFGVLFQWFFPLVKYVPRGLGGIIACFDKKFVELLRSLQEWSLKTVTCAFSELWGKRCFSFRQSLK